MMISCRFSRAPESKITAASALPASTRAMLFIRYSTGFCPLIIIVHIKNGMNNIVFFITEISFYFITPAFSQLPPAQLLHAQNLTDETVQDQIFFSQKHRTDRNRLPEKQSCLCTSR